jgi:N-acetylglutamate synthase-like GNAT family acetyltransferase
MALHSSFVPLQTSKSPTEKQGTAPFRIRAARRGDAEALGALLRELGYAQGADQATVHWVISHPEMEIYVAGDSHDRAIGMITLSHRPQLRMKGRIATIDELVVSESWRRKGVGKALVNRAVERAKVLSVRRLELLTHIPTASVPRAFYEACGFKVADALVLRIPSMDFKP